MHRETVSPKRPLETVSPQRHQPRKPTNQPTNQLSNSAMMHENTPKQNPFGNIRPWGSWDIGI